MCLFLILLDLGFQSVDQRGICELRRVLRQLARAWGWVMAARDGLGRWRWRWRCAHWHWRRSTIRTGILLIEVFGGFALAVFSFAPLSLAVALVLALTVRVLGALALVLVSVEKIN